MFIESGIGENLSAELETVLVLLALIAALEGGTESSHVHHNTGCELQ